MASTKVNPNYNLTEDVAILDTNNGFTGTVNFGSTVLISGHVTIENDSYILFKGTDGGLEGGGGLLYEDTGGTARRVIMFPGSNVVRLGNRAANGVVQIAANTTVGSGGEVVVVTVEDDKVVFESAADVYSVAWTDYAGSSTITGWTTYTQKQVRYKRIGKLVFVEFNLVGVSNNTASSFTLPNANNAVTSKHIAVRAQDNGGAYTWGLATLAQSASTVNLYTGPNATAWTNSGNKGCLGEFFYEMA